MISSHSSPNLCSYGADSTPINVLFSSRKKVISEPMVYLKGLPSTKDISILYTYLTEDVFGQMPTLLDIYTDSTGTAIGTAYIEFENHNIKSIIKRSNGSTLLHDNIKFNILTNQCRIRPLGYTYVYLESYGVWRRHWSDAEVQLIEP